MKLFIKIALLWLTVCSANATDAVPSLNWKQPWQRYQTHSIDDLVIKNANVPWQTVNSKKLFKIDPSKGIVGWYKNTFDWYGLTTNLALYIKQIHHADEVWLNGERIGGMGTLHEAWQFDKTSPRNRYRLYILSDFLKPENNQLIIKINLGFGPVKAALYPGDIGFSHRDIYIVERDAQKQALNAVDLRDMAIDTAVLVLGLVDVLLILFLFRQSIHRFPEFRWLLASSVLMLVGVLGVDLPFLLDIGFVHQKWVFMFLMLWMPMLTMMFFVSIHLFQKEAWLFNYAVAVTCCGLVTLIPIGADKLKNLCWLVWMLNAGVLYFIALVCAIKSAIEKREGSVAALIGLVIYLASIRTQWLPAPLFEHRNVIYGTLIFRYVLLFSYIQRVNKMSEDYRSHVRSLLVRVEEHRKSMARELHDGLGQHLMASKLQLQLADKAAANKHLVLVKTEIDNAIGLTRQMIKGLHPFNLDNAELPQLIRKEVIRLESILQIKIHVTFKFHDIPQEYWVHLIRIIQESVGNACHHGKAKAIEINCVSDKKRVHLHIDDDGGGVKYVNAASDAGFGMVSLAERVALIHGTLAFHQSKLGGVRVTIAFPLSQFD